MPFEFVKLELFLEGHNFLKGWLLTLRSILRNDLFLIVRLSCYDFLPGLIEFKILEVD
jgi:hypothetical protein